MRQNHLRTQWRMRAAAICSVCITLLVLAACGLTGDQKSAISTFGTAASTFGDTASKQFVAARDSVIDLNTRLLILDPGRIKPQNWDNLGASLTPENIGIRVKAADLVKTYADTIILLVTDSEQAAITNSTNQLTAAIRGYDSKGTLVSDAQLSAIG